MDDVTVQWIWSFVDKGLRVKIWSSGLCVSLALRSLLLDHLKRSLWAFFVLLIVALILRMLKRPRLLVISGSFLLIRCLDRSLVVRVDSVGMFPF